MIDPDPYRVPDPNRPPAWRPIPPSPGPCANRQESGKRLLLVTAGSVLGAAGLIAAFLLLALPLKVGFYAYCGPGEMADGPATILFSADWSPGPDASYGVARSCKDTAWTRFVWSVVLGIPAIALFVAVFYWGVDRRPQRCCPGRRP